MSEKNGTTADGRPRFSICTPLPDQSISGDTIEGLKKSLEEQTFRDFEWIPVGPGALLNGLESSADFSVKPVKSEKTERATLLNRGIKAASGEFFLILDPDSKPVPEALEKMLVQWESLPERERGYFISVSGLAALKDGRIYGNTFPSSPFDSNSIETTSHYGVQGRKWGFVRTEVLKSNLFPVFEGEGFVPEQLVLNRVGIRAITRYVNEVYLVLDAEEEPSRREELRRWASSPKGAALFYNEFSAQRVPTVHRIRSCAHYVRFSLHAGIIPDDIFKGARKKLITFFMLWPGLIMYRRDRKQLDRPLE